MTEPGHLEPVLHSRSHHSEKSVRCNREQPPHLQVEKGPRTATELRYRSKDPAQPKTNKQTLLIKATATKRKENKCLHRNLYMNVHSSIIPNSQKVGKGPMFINWWTEKRAVVFPHNGVLFSHKRHWGWDFLVVQWLRIHLPMQGTWVQSLVRGLRSH